MKYEDIREEACRGNREIPARGLAIYTWGNVSAFDFAKGVFAIKPSGVVYEELTPESMVVVDLEGKVVDGSLKPSSDTETHRVLYREFGGGGGLRGIIHTHSPYAVAFAQASRSVPVFGTTHADHGAQEIPCTPFLSQEAVAGDYERETGNLIVETFLSRGLDASDMPMVLVAGHGPFAWGKNAADAVYHGAVLEEVCKMAHLTLALNPAVRPLPEHIIRKHWERKHGAHAYYGQNS